MNGAFSISDLPQGTFLVNISYVGYASISQNITLTENTVMNFYLDDNPTELHETVITGLSSSGDKNRTPTPIDVVSAKQLQQNASSNIIDAISKMPGVSQVATGPAISKPVIRGLGFNRVVVVDDGIRQEGQQWGDEHGIEIDEFAANTIEILKGPASITYGSDAMAGVVNILPAPSLPDGTVTGNFKNNYQTNNGAMASSLNCAGNLRDITWDARYSHKQAHDYFNRYDGGVFDSRFTQNAGEAMIGVNGSWGYSHLSVSAFHLETGIVEGVRDSATGNFIKQVAVNDSTIADSLVNDNDLHSYQMTTPYQDIRHYKTALNSNFVLGNGMLKTIFGFQQNQRKEFGDVLNPDQYGLYFLLNTFSYDVRYVFPEKNDLQFTAGVNGMQQHSMNKGIEFLVPEYSLFDAGAFVTARKSWKKLDVSGGIRFDIRDEQTMDLYLSANGTAIENPDSTSIHQFTAFHSTFNGFAASLGASYQLPNSFYLKANASRGFRAPNIGELASNGVHEGTIQYMIGDPHLKAENSLQFDFAVGTEQKHLTAEVDVFSNSISNYIFAQKLNSINGGDSIRDGFQTLKFTQGNAILNGGEATIDLHPHPLDWLHFENSFGFVIARQKNVPDSMRYLPFSPAPIYRSEVRTDFDKCGKNLRSVYLKFELEDHFAQNHYYSAFHTETATPAYLLLNAGFGGDVTVNDQVLCSVFFSVNNIADVAYQDHLSRLKYADENYVTGRTGVYNMGRNFSLKLNIPLYIKKTKVN
ncbi:MAG TPA: TonB-dependent receptor [Bacteroidia bacterium]|nr:TonB-dependent receptor [Bacteroidia bacterium]